MINENVFKHQIAEEVVVYTEYRERAFCDFQLSCKNCYEIIYLDKYNVSILRNGAPKASEIKRVFSNPEFDKVKTCNCCGQSDFAKSYSYKSIPYTSPEEELIKTFSAEQQKLWDMIKEFNNINTNTNGKN